MAAPAPPVTAAVSVALDSALLLKHKIARKYKHFPQKSKGGRANTRDTDSRLVTLKACCVE
eukprot:5350115-Prymnesium_polylepis.1